ncbi:TraM recognition domain-containing protein (plasmid) [Saccharopolyspora sp. ID03-671]|uniref:type IV secretory system conjugative DNA transfer family protein n=1 Tax=Saccharopolyspora sp. ID03-671 TaxID=3073066 RepID=UPI00324B2498
MNATRPATPGHPMVPLALLGAYTAISALLWLACGLGGLLAGTGWTGGTPITAVVDLALGTATWPGAYGWIALVAIVLVLATPAVLVVLKIARRRRAKTRVDDSTQHLAKPSEYAAYSPEGIKESAQRLRRGGIDPDNPDEHGVLIGEALPSHVPFRASWEDVSVFVAGPRTGKTTSWVVPAIVNAPGPVVATSNKRDIHDHTRGVREQVGTCYVFDPQSIAKVEPSWWYNPLRAVTGPRKASELTAHFAAATTAPDASKDSYFDTEGENLCAYFFLAAARSGKPITQAYEWITDHRAARQALDCLRPEDRLIAGKLRKLIELPEKQREGVFGSALKLLQCLEEPSVLRWVTPPPDDEDRPEFAPEEFVNSTHTLYLLSREGVGSAGPLTAALTFDIMEAGRERAADLPGGRLDPPILYILDEAANVVRIRELPNLYSHFGSAGQNVLTIVQSWEQMVEAWGRSGAQKLWDASNVRVYGGGNADADFLEKVSKLVGPMDEVVWSTTYDRHGGGSRSSSVRTKQILDVADLQALPRGRALALASGSPAVMLQPVPWMSSPWADKVRASLETYEPTGRTEPAADDDDDEQQGAA